MWALAVPSGILQPLCLDGEAVLELPLHSPSPLPLRRFIRFVEVGGLCEAVYAGSWGFSFHSKYILPASIQPRDFCK